eukprot:10195519-Alexandrium_andersonii.AAC.1
MLADSRLLRGPFGPLARLRPQPRPAGRWRPTHVLPWGVLEPELFEPMNTKRRPPPARRGRLEDPARGRAELLVAPRGEAVEAVGA